MLASLGNPYTPPRKNNPHTITQTNKRKEKKTNNKSSTKIFLIFENNSSSSYGTDDANISLISPTIWSLYIDVTAHLVLVSVYKETDNSTTIHCEFLWVVRAFAPLFCITYVSVAFPIVVKILLFLILNVSHSNLFPPQFDV